MLVVRGNRTDFSPSEQLVVDWLQVQDLPGLVVAGCRVAAAHGLRRLLGRGIEADLLIVTERACLVLEVENLSEPVAGTVQCPVAGKWSMVGVAGDPVPVRAGDANPFDRVLEAVEATKDIAGQLDPALPGCVLGLLVVVPFPGCPVTLDVDRALLPEGTEIQLADEPHELHEWVAGAADRFGVAARCDARWTVPRVTGLLETLLGDHHGVSAGELAAAGFPDASAGTGATPVRGDAPGAPPGHSGPSPGAEARRAAAARRTSLVSLLSAGAALLAAVLGLWAFSSCSESRAPAESTPLPAEPVVNRPAPPPAPAPADPTCYPFQPGC